MPSFEMNEVNLFSALKSFVPAPPIRNFLSKLSITDKVALVANYGKISLVKETTNFISASCLIYLSYYQEKST